MQILMEDKTAQCLVTLLVYERSAVLGVTSVGASGWHVVQYLGLAKHHDARVQAILGIVHEPHVLLLYTLLGGQLTHLPTPASFHMAYSSCDTPFMSTRSLNDFNFLTTT